MSSAFYQQIEQQIEEVKAEAFTKQSVSSRLNSKRRLKSLAVKKCLTSVRTTTLA